VHSNMGVTIIYSDCHRNHHKSSISVGKARETLQNKPREINAVSSEDPRRAATPSEKGKAYSIFTELHARISYLHSFKLPG